MQRLVEAERAQTALSNTSMATMNNGGTATESEILLFRNQLKVETNIAHHHALQRKPREKRESERELLGYCIFPKWNRALNALIEYISWRIYYSLFEEKLNFPSSFIIQW